jgi:asparagine N-glycosylation enzyme membrane subunit Stt3
MAAFGIVEIIRPLIQNNANPSREGRRLRKVLGIDRGLAFIFIFLLLVGTSPQLWSSINMADQPTALASSAIPANLGGEYPKDWLQALNWMKDNLDDDAIVVHWWDYGYWVEAIANKTTLADGATWDNHQISNVARMMMLPLNESLPLLRKYNATHILVFVTYNPYQPEQFWPAGDNGKWLWMIQIGGFNVSDFITLNIETMEEEFTERALNSTLFNMMYGNFDTEHLVPVFISEYGFVRVFRIEYS